MIIHIDFETRSMEDLQKAGLYKYAACDSTDVWCVAYAVDEEEPQIWFPGEEVPDAIIEGTRTDGGLAGMNPTPFFAHNAQFERILWREVMTKKYGWPAPDLSQWRCTMVMAYAAAMPGSLDGAASALGLSEGKDQAGYRLMMQMCRPRSISQYGGRPVWWDAQDKVRKLAEYCKQDVRVEREIAKRLPPLSGFEQNLWCLDQAINDRGVAIDTRTVRAAQGLVDISVDRLNAEMRQVTDGAVEKCTNVAEITRYLRGRGLDADSVAKAALAGLMEDAEANTDFLAVRVLELRQEAGKASNAKLGAMINLAGPDKRARGLLQFHAASTGRWGGRHIQTQNLPRGELKPAQVEDAIQLILAGDYDLLELMYGPPTSVVSSCLRGLLTAAPGHALMVADFAAIEARVLAWLAGEQWVLDVFRGDGKIYEAAAAGIYNVNKDAVTEDQRFVGKVATLALGYQGGVRAFQAMAKAYGADIPDKKAEEIRDGWRAANPRIVALWSAAEEAAMLAIRNRGKVYHAGDYVKFGVSGSFLFCRLPSGRKIAYPYPVIETKEMPWGKTKSLVGFKGVDSLSKKWGPQNTYGGKLVENFTQAVARDLLAESLIRVDAHGYRVIMHVHDEIVSEVPDGFGSVEEFEALVAQAPKWANGLPMAAEAWEGGRYRK